MRVCGAPPPPPSHRFLVQLSFKGQERGRKVKEVGESDVRSTQLKAQEKVFGLFKKNYSQSDLTVSAAGVSCWKHTFKTDPSLRIDSSLFWLRQKDDMITDSQSQVCCFLLMHYYGIIPFKCTITRVKYLGDRKRWFYVGNDQAFNLKIMRFESLMSEINKYYSKVHTKQKFCIPAESM